MKGQCIDVGGTTTLVEGNAYFLFPNGPDHAYVSKFDNPTGHFGCYRQSLFKEVKEESKERPSEPPLLDWELVPGQVYKALLIWTDKQGFSYREGKQYFLKIFERCKSQVMFYKDSDCKELGGFFPKHWFIDYQIVEQIEFSDKIEIENEPTMFEEWEQMKLF